MKEKAIREIVRVEGRVKALLFQSCGARKDLPERTKHFQSKSAFREKLSGRNFIMFIYPRGRVFGGNKGNDGNPASRMDLCRRFSILIF